jgi:hypothetical protein
MVEQKKQKNKRSFFKDLKNIRKNYKIVKNHPLAGLRFKYKVQRNTLIAFGSFIIYQFYSIIKNYSGTGYMSWIGRGFTLLILFIIVNKAYSSMKILKKNLDLEEEYYRNNPQALKNSPKQNVKSDIDEILNRFEKAKGGKE